MRTRTILAQFRVLRAFNRESVFTGRMNKWWKMLTIRKGLQPLAMVRMNMIPNQVYPDG